jgi:hypothetical protein
MCAQPGIKYYMWQVEVMLHNFEKHGINMNNVHIVFAKNSTEPEGVYRYAEAEALQKRYGAQIFWYEDTRPDIRYISSIRPNVLKQHFKALPELQTATIFYHDCDIIFTKTPDWSKFENDNIWYLSDTNSYINSDYIRSKGDDVYQLMCEIVGIHPLTPIKYNEHSGGAQYILKNVNYKFWDKVENDSQELFEKITSLNDEKIQVDRHTMPGEVLLREPYHPLQIWCADMWAVLWNGWMQGNETKCVPEMNFTWGTDAINRWGENVIYHNAGVINPQSGFYKGLYTQEYPYNKNLVPTSNCSSKYYNEIKEVEKQSVI